MQGKTSLWLLTTLSVALGFPILSICGKPQSNTAEHDYKANCVLCHSADGSGSSPAGKAMKAKDLRSAEVQSASDADLTAAITDGKGKMPAFGRKLTPDSIKGLVAYVRSFAKK